MEIKRKRVKVVMLPIDNRSPLVLDAFNRLHLTEHYGSDLWSSSAGKDSFQHLYFLSYEEIKEGDWFYSTFNDHQPKIQQRKGNWTTCFNQHKIIATTDPKLNKGIRTVCKKCKASGGPISTKCSKCNGTGVRIKESLPQPSKAFIEKYCKLGGIDEVDVEYELICDESNPDKSDLHLITKLKVDSTITIHSIKDSWSREEIKTILYSELEIYEKEVPHPDDSSPDEFVERVLKFL